MHWIVGVLSRRPWARPFFCLLPFLVAVLLALGCAPKKTPHLLEIREVGPETLEAGTDLRILGSGFPENHRGVLTLHGTAYAPARMPRPVVWTLPVEADSRTSISVRLEPEMLAKLLRDADHVTFSGRASVEFPPVFEGRPALTGESTDLGLDLFTRPLGPSNTTVSADHESADHRSAVATAPLPAKFAAFLGIELDPKFVIRAVAERSVAEEAGLQVGDQLHALDHVHLDSMEDFVPQARAQVSLLTYSREGIRGTTTATLARSDFQVLDPHVATRALSALAAFVLALCLIARPPRFLIWLVAKKSKKTLGKRDYLVDLFPRHQALAYPTFLAVLLGYYFLFKHPWTALLNLDFLLCATTGIVLVLVGAFCLGGARNSRQGFSVLGALSAATFQLLALGPVLIAFVFRASEVGTLRLSDLVHAQGAWPTEWGLVQSPWTFLLATSALVALVPVSGRRAPLEGQVGARGLAVVMGRVLEWSGQLVFLGLWLSVFADGLGGIETSAWLSTLLLTTKFLLLVQLLTEVRVRVGRVRLGESGPLSGRLSWGLSCGALLFGSVQFVDGGRLTEGDWVHVFSLALCGALVTLLLLSISRSWAHAGRRGDPWI